MTTTSATDNKRRRQGAARIQRDGSAARSGALKDGGTEASSRRPTAQEVFDRINECQGKEGMAKMWRSWNVLELIIDYGGLKGLPAGPEAMQVYSMMEALFGEGRVEA